MTRRSPAARRKAKILRMTITEERKQSSADSQIESPTYQACQKISQTVKERLTPSRARPIWPDKKNRRSSWAPTTGDLSMKSEPSETPDAYWIAHRQGIEPVQALVNGRPLVLRRPFETRGPANNSACPRSRASLDPGRERLSDEAYCSATPSRSRTSCWPNPITRNACRAQWRRHTWTRTYTSNQVTKTEE